ncbi:MAG: GAF domain-containing protein [Actinobacteria bacterium]|nr:GAF domain-containing protein [Actinomycetota bacterium]
MSPASSRWHGLYGRLLTLVLRPTARPLWLGIAVAVGFILAETIAVLQLKRVAPENAFGAVFLLGVLVVSAGWGFGLAVATSLASALVYVYFHLEGADSLVPALFVFLPVALLANILAGQARLRAAALEASHAEVTALAKQQAALRRVATVVARGADPADVYPAAIAELTRGLEVEHVTLVGFDTAGTCVVLAARDSGERATMPVGERFPLDGDSISARILRTGEPARIDDYGSIEGPIGARLRDLGVASGVGAPVIVGGRVRGALLAGSSAAEPLPPETEDRVGDFADLIATAIYNAETRAELTASRARIVAAADQARRGFERDLHDGAQQRIVSLGLELRAFEASMPADPDDTRRLLDRVIAGLTGLHTDLQELSRGMHPAILSRGGLGPAIKTIARRSKVPVELDVEVDRRLPEPVEVAAYYVVAEALTNTAKHARASGATVRMAVDGEWLRVSIGDDGIGGAISGAGSGLIGLKDRVAAVSGELDIVSPPGGGTTLSVAIPVGAATC